MENSKSALLFLIATKNENGLTESWKLYFYVVLLKCELLLNYSAVKS